MALKGELQQEADELGIGEQANGLSKLELVELIDNFKNLEVDSAEEEIEEVSMEEIDESFGAFIEEIPSVFPEYEVDLEKLATQETVALIVQYRNTRGRKGGDELTALVRECVK